MPPVLNPLKRLLHWRFRKRTTKKLYGAIVAQARLPAFYRTLGVPDTLRGRFTVLSLHLFAVLHRLKREGALGLNLAQELVDRFTEDMETILRETGVSDLRIPKTVRVLAASSHALLECYEAAFAAGEAELACAIAASLPHKAGDASLSSASLAFYVTTSVRQLDRQPIVSLEHGRLDWPRV